MSNRNMGTDRALGKNCTFSLDVLLIVQILKRKQ